MFKDAQCTFFGPEHEKFLSVGLRESLRPHWKNRGSSNRVALWSELTEQVTSKLPAPPVAEEMKFPFEPDYGKGNTNYTSTIDRHLFPAMVAAGVPPAKLTSDFEFIRRVTLDLTGRIPTVDRVLGFVVDNTPDKRAKLVEELLSRPEWIDKWTMYFGDLLKNTSQNTQITIYQQGVGAFHKWIRDSLSGNKPYNQMVQEIIAAQGTNSYDESQGPINWLVLGSMGGGPYQDHIDARTAKMAEQFLAMAHFNCIGCHSGAGHLEPLTLWGANATRLQFWQMASFLSRTETFATRVDPASANPVYWGLRENLGNYSQDYRLNTTTGNRPARQPIGNMRNVAPVYPFSGRGPAEGENYRVALAREVTSDFQFARASVNYIWKEFFGIGIVDPPELFDLARLDPDNPPPGPWTLQPSHPRLLKVLAQEFIDKGYDLKALMRQIVNSKAYQLSSRYEGTWNPNWERLFARKLVRRLWAEEIHDAIVQSSNIIPSYNLGAVYGTVSWAMQLPEPRNTPGEPIRTFLNEFLRGNRDEENRNSTGSSIPQALNLMNHSLVMNRVMTNAPGAANGLLVKNLNLPNDGLVNTLFLTVLSRYPTDAEKTTALANLGSGNRTQMAEQLLWSLYNKVDFIFNY